MFKNFHFLTDGEIELKLEKTEVLFSGSERSTPQYHFDIFAADMLVGKIRLRVCNNDFVVHFSGHIGYEIFPDFRGNHYAAKACNLLKEVALAHKLKTLILTSTPDNFASRRTCEMIGAIFINKVDLPIDCKMYLQGKRQVCRYEWQIV